jgi:hypothetical protein
MNSKFIKFDPIDWRSQCERMADDASNNCAQSHFLYVCNLSSAVDKKLSDLASADHPAAIEIARQFDYATRQEIQAEQAFNDEHGFCTHGIELGCCPAGCGSGPDD